MLTTSVLSYSIIKDSGGYVITWAPGLIPMQIKLPTSPLLSDGTSQSSSLLAAMDTWNAHLGVVQFSAQEMGPGAYELGNGANEIVMDSTIEGDEFGSGTLAIAVSFRVSNERVESDVVFNTAYEWDSYRGNLLQPEDIRRVAIHELGHVLGLDHPDEAGQSVLAIMNSNVSSVDALQSDDIAGGQILYGAPGFVPTNDNFANATTVHLASGSIHLSGTNIAATAEAGETAHIGEAAHGSVWWKWTAPVSGSMTIATMGSSFDTVLGVYTGATVSSLTEVAANDDVDPGVIRTSSITFVATGGTTYYIVVDGWSKFFGTIALKFKVRPFKATVVAWGYNDEGQAVVPAALGELQALSAGTRHTLVLKSDGTVGAWGQGFYRQTAVPPGLTGVEAVAAGGTHSLALKSDGTVVAWGDDSFGTPGSAATPPAGLSQVVAIAAGWRRSMALRADGTVVSWGSSQGLPKPENLTEVVAIAAGAFHNLALKRDGTVVGWGDNHNGAATVPAGLDNVIAIAAGGSASGGHSLALKNDGTVVAWGYNAHGQCNVPAGLSNVMAIAAGGHFSLALKADGTIVAWGQNDQGQLNIPQGSAYVGLEAGFGHGVGLVVAQLPVITSQPTGLTVNLGDVIQLSVSAQGTAPLSYQWKRNGTALSEGGAITGTTSPTLQISNAQASNAGSYTVEVSNAAGTVSSAAAAVNVANIPSVASSSLSRTVIEGEPVSFSITMAGDGPYTYQWRHNRRIIAGATGPTLNLSSATIADRGIYEAVITGADGGVVRSTMQLQVGILHPTFVTWGEYSPTPPVIEGSVAAIDGGVFGAVLILKGDGTLAAWGNNAYGQTAIPTGLNHIADISVGLFHSLAVKDDGSVVGWGENSSGQATPPVGLDSVVAVAAGYTHSLALKSDGTLVGWGTSDYGQHIVPAGLKNVIAIVTGRFESLALKSDGTVFQWGYDFSGNYFVPAGLADVVAIANAKDSGRSYALKADGTVVGWGWPSAIIPAGLSGVQAIASGPYSTLAVRSDGTVEGWGSHAMPPTGLTGVILVTTMGVSNLALVGPEAPPSIIIQPGNQSINAGGMTTFTVVVKGNPTPALQWQVSTNGGGSWTGLTNAAPYSGVTTGTLSIVGATTALNGNLYRVVAANSAGDVTSEAAMLAVAIDMTGIPDGFDVLGYLARYLDIAEQYGNDLYGAWLHYHDVGIYEGQVYDERFRVEEYLSLNPDLLTMFGDDWGAALVHWLEIGRAEGRRGRYLRPGADLNGDGHTDLLWQNRTTGQVYLWLMNGTALVDGVDYGLHDTSWHAVGMGDLNGDGHTDLLWQNRTTGQVYLWLMEGTTMVGGVDYGLHDLAWGVAGTGDLTGDGHVDVLWQNSVTGQVYLWVMNGTTMVDGVDYGFHDASWTVSGMGDIDGDGHVDVLWQNSVSGQVYLWLMDGPTMVGGIDYGLHETGWRAVATADLNQDGHMDILWQNRTTGHVYLWVMENAVMVGGFDFGFHDTDWHVVN